ncbi:hypothetical protein DsansV1_C11g0113101 [Dioscorea sansibarensis]
MSPSPSASIQRNCGGWQRCPGVNLASQLKHKPFSRRASISVAFDWNWRWSVCGLGL